MADILDGMMADFDEAKAIGEVERLEEAEPIAEVAKAEDAEDAAAVIEGLREKLRALEEEREARERELSCLELLGRAGLPTELADAVKASPDMEATVELIRSAVQRLVDAEVSERCRSAAPPTGMKATLTREELIRMPVAELQRIRDCGYIQL